MRFVDDDRKAAGEFLSRVNRKILRSRFSEGSAWTPDHITLVYVGSEPVAMADAIILGDGAAAIAGLLAQPGYGAYAVKALLQLKRRLSVPHWESTLRVPTDATMTISRRYFTQTFDQATSEMAVKMVERYGQHAHLHPMPILASDAFLSMTGLPPLRAWDQETKLQVLKAASLAGGLSLRAPKGQVLPMHDVAAIAFDLLGTSYGERQQFSRMLMAMMIGAHGHDPSPLVGRMLKPGGGSEFMSAVQHYGNVPIPAGGAFEIERMSPTDIQGALRKVRSIAAR